MPPLTNSNWLDEGANICTHTHTFTLTPCHGLSLYARWSVIPVILAGASVCRANCPAVSWKTVDFDVFWEVVTAGEFLLTHWTLVWLDTWVGPPVSRQFVWPGKPEGKNKRCFSFGKDNEEKVRVRCGLTSRDLAKSDSSHKSDDLRLNLTKVATGLNRNDSWLHVWLGMTWYLS